MTPPLSFRASNHLSIDLTKYTTQASLTTAITNLVNGAPVDLNTLKKLDNAVANDPDFAFHATALIDTKTRDAFPRCSYCPQDLPFPTIKHKEKPDEAPNRGELIKC